MQTNNLVLLSALFSTQLLSATGEALHSIKLKIRTQVPSGYGLISAIVFTISVPGLNSTIADIRQKLNNCVHEYASQHPTCQSCGKCQTIRVAKALDANNQNFKFFLKSFHELPDNTNMVRLLLAGLNLKDRPLTATKMASTQPSL